MKLTPYISPQTLFSVSPDEKLDQVAVRKHKKRLLAEFELNKAAEIHLGGISFDKSSLLTFFEGLEDPEEIAFHQFVQEHVLLRHFLELGSMDLFQPGYRERLMGEDQFSTHILPRLTPFFCYRFNENSVKAFKQKDWETLSVLNLEKPLVGIDHYAACYQGTYQALQLKVEHLEELARRIKKGVSPGPEVQEACDEMMISTLNQLPDHFEGLRNAYGMALEDLAMNVYNEHQRGRLTKIILRQGLKLTLNQDTRTRLEHVHDQLLKIEPDDEILPEIEEKISSGMRKIKAWHVALAGVVLIKIVLLILA